MLPSQPRPGGAPLVGKALRAAASQGGLVELARLVKLGYDPDASEGDADCKAAWIRRGCPTLNVDAADESGYTALIKAAANGHICCVDHLISKGADVNAQTVSHMSALHWVAINDHIRCAESLIKARADASLVNSCGETALDYAIERGSTEAVEEREAFAKNVEEKKASERSCHTAASKGDLAALTRLVGQGLVNVDTPDEGGYTPLLKAAANNHLECVVFLLAKGANVNIQTKSRMTALQLTVAINDDALCAAPLVKAGADTSLKNEDGYTALDYARQSNNAEAIRLLEMADDAQSSGRSLSPVPPPVPPHLLPVVSQQVSQQISTQISPEIGPEISSDMSCSPELSLNISSEIAISPHTSSEIAISPWISAQRWLNGKLQGEGGDSPLVST